MKPLVQLGLVSLGWGEPLLHFGQGFDYTIFTDKMAKSHVKKLGIIASFWQSIMLEHKGIETIWVQPEGYEVSNYLTEFFLIKTTTKLGIGEGKDIPDKVLALIKVMRQTIERNSQINCS